MNLHRARVASALAVAGALVLAGCGDDNPTSTGEGNSGSTSDLSGTLQASGASSQQAAMTAWIAEYENNAPDVRVLYDSVGSGAGRENLLSGAVDFAGSDAALNETERQQVQETCGPDGAMNIPVYISPIAVPFNLDGVESLQLKPATLAQIFNQDITTWNDPAIAAENPGVDLPDTKITVVNRSDESGTTENFTEYLAEVAGDAWPHEAGKSWPVGGGEAAAQTTGVIRVIGDTNGAIGYSDASAVGELDTAKIGVGEEYVEYSPEAAAKVVDASEPADTGVPGDLALELARDTTESGAYPIVLVSYHIVCSAYDEANTANLVKDFVGYVVSEEGQATAAEAAGSAPISDSLRTKATESLDMISGGS